MKKFTSPPRKILWSRISRKQSSLIVKLKNWSWNIIKQTFLYQTRKPKFCHNRNLNMAKESEYSTILSWNCRSVHNKLSKLKKFINKTKPHVVCLQETWIRDPYLPSFQNHNPNYKNRLGTSLNLKWYSNFDKLLQHWNKCKTWSPDS